MVKFGHLDAMMKVHWAVIRAKTAQNLQHNKLNCQKIASESLPAIHIQRFYWVMDESMHVAHSAIHTAPWDWIWKVNSSRPSKLCQAKNLSTSNLELITWWCWLNLVKSIRLAVPSKGNWDAYHHEHHRAKHDEEKDNCWSQAFLLHGMSSLLMQFGPQRTVRLSEIVRTVRCMHLVWTTIISLVSWRKTPKLFSHRKKRHLKTSNWSQVKIDSCISRFIWRSSQIILYLGLVFISL